MPSFLEGFANKLGGDVDEFTANKLKMALMSKQMELEANTRMQEMQFQHQLGQVPGEQVAGLAKMMGATGDTSALNGMELPEPLAGAALTGIGIGNRIPQISFEKTTDATGKEILIPVNRRTGQVGTQGTVIGNTASAGHEITTAGATYGTLHNTLEGVRSKIANFLGAQDASQLPAQYANLQLNQLLQNNPQAKAYFDDLPALSLRLDKELTGTSRFASQIVAGTQHGLPGMTDTLQTAMAKLNNYDSMGHAAVDAVYNAYQVPPQQRNFGQAPNPQSQQPPSDPYAGMSTQEKMNLLMQRMQVRQGKQPKGQ